MNIKDIIDAERWVGGYDSNYNHVDGNTAEVFYSDHNTSIARIEKAVMKYIAELEERIAELEKTINQLSKADASLRAQNEAQERNAVASAKRIAELEAQLPKVVKTRSLSGGWQSTAIIP